MKKAGDIIPIAQDKLEAAMALVWEVFSEFEAPDYSEEGIAEFSDFIKLEAVLQRQRGAGMLLWGYYINGEIIGVIAAEEARCHINLLFVKASYHRQGIARTLYEMLLMHFKANTGHDTITVNSSPYAVEAYKRLGFIPTGTEQTVNGLRFTPMKHVFR